VRPVHPRKDAHDRAVETLTRRVHVEELGYRQAGRNAKPVRVVRRDPLGSRLLRPDLDDHRPARDLDAPVLVAPPDRHVGDDVRLAAERGNHDVGDIARHPPAHLATIAGRWPFLQDDADLIEASRMFATSIGRR
jgi:hypothetical protein